VNQRRGRPVFLAAARESRLPRPLHDEWSWQLGGQCRQYPAEVFFPDDEGRVRLREREESAKRICRACPVLAACRDHALRVPEVFGVWGAMTARERANMLATRTRRQTANT
jgi:WhiB family transcriptional regulator, redox-sensing transcriptional regulator